MWKLAVLIHLSDSGAHHLRAHHPLSYNTPTNEMPRVICSFIVIKHVRLARDEVM